MFHADSVDRVPLPEPVLRQCLGGSGLGAWLLLEEGEPRADPLAAERSARVRVQPAGRQPADDVRQICGRQQESADRPHQRFARQQRFCDCRQALRLRRHRHRRTGRGALGVDHRRWTCPSRSGRGPSLGHVSGDGNGVESAARRRLSDRLDRPGRRASGPLRDDLARRPPRRPRRKRGRAGQQERQGDRRARHTALRVGAPARAD